MIIKIDKNNNCKYIIANIYCFLIIYKMQKTILDTCFCFITIKSNCEIEFRIFTKLHIYFVDILL